MIDEQIKLASEHDIRVWLECYELKTEDGKLLDFAKHSFLVQPFRDESRKLVVKKAAQIGFSTLVILKTLWMSRHRKLNIIYTLPSFSDVNSFVGGKVNRIIGQNPILHEYTLDRDTIEQKHVGDSVIYYRGTITQQAALMVSADLLVIDEYDRSRHSIVDQYASRLQHSDYRGEWYFSNPSASGFGVDEKWEKSDQKHWFIKCNGCEKEQFLDWPDSIDLEKECYQCKFCKKELSDEERRIGRWLRKKGKENAEFSGYWISLLMAPWVSAKQILKYYREKPEDYFYNFVLGKEYIGAGNKLTWESFAQNLKEQGRTPTKEARVVIGVDTGLKLDYVMGDEEGLFWQASANDYDELDKYMDRWPNAIAIVDEGGDLIGSRKFYEKWLGRVFLCHLGGDRKTKELVQWKEGDEQGSCIVDRYRIIQLVVDEFGERRTPVWGLAKEWTDYWQDWKNLTRIKILDPITGEHKGYKWVRSGRDHKALATCFYRVGMDRYGFGKAEILNVQPVIRAPAGPEIDPYGKFRHITRIGEDPVKATLDLLAQGEEEDWRNI